MKSSVINISITSIFLLTVGCTEPGRTTGYSTAAGSALGAGLGAIVGSQVGSPGAGLAIGAVAGAGAGAAIGNALESHEKKLAANDERLQRQEVALQAQRNEAANLRNVERDSYSRSSSPAVSARGRSDTFAFNRAAAEGSARYASPAEIQQARSRSQSGTRANATTNPGTYSYPARAQLNAQSIRPAAEAAPVYSLPSRPQPSSYTPPMPTEPRLPPSAARNDTGTTTTDSHGVKEKDLIVAPTSSFNGSGVESTVTSRLDARIDGTAAETAAAEAELDTGKEEGKRVDSPTTESTGSGSAATLRNAKVSTPECSKGDQEMAKAEQASDAADKLFHIRRALRLCPNNSTYHVHLSELYLTMNRKEDAVFELNEALKLDPVNSTASSKLETLQRGAVASNSIASSKEPKLPSSRY